MKRMGGDPLDSGKPSTSENIKEGRFAWNPSYINPSIPRETRKGLTACPITTYNHLPLDLKNGREAKWTGRARRREGTYSPLTAKWWRHARLLVFRHEASAPRMLLVFQSPREERVEETA